MKAAITILSLGSGDPELLNLKTIRAMEHTERLILRTGKHPAASWLEKREIPFSTLDFLYEETEDFDELNRRISEFLIREASDIPVVYAVTDALTDYTVRSLIHTAAGKVPIEIIPGISSYDLNLSVACFIPDTGITVVPASELSEAFRYDPELTLLVTELDNPVLAGQVKLFLSGILEDEHIVILLQRGNPEPIPLWQLDRKSGIDHRSAVLIPGSGFLSRQRFVMNDLTEIMDRLRSSDGCPWDRIQTHQSLQPYLIEEAWECIDCIDTSDYDHLCEELGDLLFQLVFHASIGKSFDEFTISDVITGICAKMIRRHPHVFGCTQIGDPEGVRKAWEEIKQAETGHRSPVSSLEDVSTGLPSLKYASKIFRKLTGAGFITDTDSTVEQEIRHLLTDLRSDPDRDIQRKLGQLLLLCTELCTLKGFDAELVLHQSADRMKNTLVSAEKKAIHDGKSLEHLTFGELGVYLNHVKDEIE